MSEAGATLRVKLTQYECSGSQSSSTAQTTKITMQKISAPAINGHCGCRIPPHLEEDVAGEGSSTCKIRSAFTFISFCTIPLGQSISISFAISSVAMPKCTRLSLDER